MDYHPKAGELATVDTVPVYSGLRVSSLAAMPEPFRDPLCPASGVELDQDAVWIVNIEATQVALGV